MVVFDGLVLMQSYVTARAGLMVRRHGFGSYFQSILFTEKVKTNVVCPKHHTILLIKLRVNLCMIEGGKLRLNGNG